jgi:hypothetical protein
MLLTEKQAAVTWCPQLPRREAFHEHPSVPRALPPPGTPPATGCLGSKCMAWRWRNDLDPDLPFDSRRVMLVRTTERWSCEHCGGSGHVPDPENKDPSGKVGCPECEGAGNGFKNEPVGYCGLAGHVEVTP